MMKHHDEYTNDLLARVVERFLIHHREAEGNKNPAIREILGKMCTVELCEMHMLTQ